jgi:hypothetical protein
MLNNAQNEKNYVIFKVIFVVKCIFKDIFDNFLEHICMVLNTFISGPYL